MNKKTITFTILLILAFTITLAPVSAGFFQNLFGGNNNFIGKVVETNLSTSSNETVDSTNRIAYWYGKVNQHNVDGTWYTDPDGRSGANIDKLTYCRKWWPDTIAVEDYGSETITDWKDAGNQNNYVSTRPVYKCVQGVLEDPIICDKDVKQCSDGSTVIRNPKNNCEFDQCPVVKTIPACTDSDHGQNAFVKGFIIFNDTPFIDSCIGSNLEEYYCDVNEKYANVQSKIINCEFGCVDGACLKEAVKTITCNDSDGGMNIYKKGISTLSSDTQTSTDWCKDDILNEYYCSSKSIKSQKILCKFGCVDGACLKEAVKTITCNDSDNGLNIYSKGTVYLSDGTKYPDKCVTPTKGQLGEGFYAQDNGIHYNYNDFDNDSCSGDDCYVADSLCSDNNNLGFTFKVKPCEFGCVNGACNKELSSDSNSDKNNKISFWYGKVNQHYSPNNGWSSDPDGVAGAGTQARWGDNGWFDRKLEYCQRFWPDTTEVVKSNKMTITTWRDRGNVGGPYTSTRITYDCKAPSTSFNTKKIVSFASEKGDIDFSDSFIADSGNNACGKDTCTGVIIKKTWNDKDVLTSISCSDKITSDNWGKFENLILGKKEQFYMEKNDVVEYDNNFQIKVVAVGETSVFVKVSTNNFVDFQTKFIGINKEEMFDKYGLIVGLKDLSYIENASDNSAVLVIYPDSVKTEFDAICKKNESRLPRYCYDDDGDNTYHAGFVVNENKTYKDYCISNTTVKEFVCDKNLPDSFLFKCKFGCVNGACQQKQNKTFNKKIIINKTKINRTIINKTIINKTKEDAKAKLYDKLADKLDVNGEKDLVPNCSGCDFSGRCIPIGVRINGQYCSSLGNLMSQKGEGLTCENSFECGTNVCVNGKCASSGFIQKIFNFFRRWA